MQGVFNAGRGGDGDSAGGTGGGDGGSGGPGGSAVVPPGAVRAQDQRFGNGKVTVTFTPA
jgi:hypothetical protein